MKISKPFMDKIFINTLRFFSIVDTIAVLWFATNETFLKTFGDLSTEYQPPGALSEIIIFLKKN